MQVHFTETAISKAIRDAAKHGKRTDLSDITCPGLRIRLTPHGLSRTKDQATFVLACRDSLGAMRRYLLGTYPDMGISEAREAARTLHRQVKAGADPTADRKKVRAMGSAAKLGIGTLSAVLDQYGQKHGKKSWAASRKRIDLVFKSLLQRPISTLTVADFQLTADRYAFPKSASFAVRSIRPALKWAAAHGRNYLTGDMGQLTQPARTERRKRVLDKAELKKVLPCISAPADHYLAAHLLMLLTLARREEVAQARYCNIDLRAGLWTLPETKNGEVHIIPLSRQAVALLKAMKPKTKKTDLVFHTSGLKTIGNWDRATKRIHKLSKTSGWNRHDLRRTGATMLGNLGILPDIVEAALNHVSIRSPLAATYNQSRYRPQVAQPFTEKCISRSSMRSIASFLSMKSFLSMSWCASPGKMKRSCQMRSGWGGASRIG